MTQATYTESDEDGIAALLTGHRIVNAEMGRFDLGSDFFYGPATGKLTLDDGREVYVIPNQGGCSCSAGDYDLSHLATVDNIITSVRLAQEGDTDYGEFTGAYRIYVVADAAEINVLGVDGTDGNGYYGTGYQLIVRAP